MPTREAMEDLTEVINQFEKLTETALAGVIPSDTPEGTRLTPFVVGSLLELTRQLVYHVKQLQLEVLNLEQQLHNLPPR